MAKPTKNAGTIILFLSIIAFIGIVAGFYYSSVIVALLCLLPLVGYQIYRVEGKSTTYSAVGIAILILAEILFLIFNVSFDLAGFLESDSKYIAGYNIPLTDIKVLTPTLMAVLCIVLFKNTRGSYTKAMAVIIFIAAFAVIYMLDSQMFTELLKMAINDINKYF